MSISSFGRYALTNCAAVAMLAGCGGSQPPIEAVSLSADGVAHHKTFHYTGKRQSFTVPAGVKWITVVARGGAGGLGYGGYGGGGGGGGGWLVIH
jgi:hypothetical protein